MFIQPTREKKHWAWVDKGKFNDNTSLTVNLELSFNTYSVCVSFHNKYISPVSQEEVLSLLNEKSISKKVIWKYEKKYGFSTNFFQTSEQEALEFASDIYRELCAYFHKKEIQ